MKKLLINYATYGTGHRAVAMYIKEYFENKGYEVKTIDLLAYSIPILGPLTKVVNEFLMTKFPSIWSLVFFASNNKLTGTLYQKMSLKLFDNKKLRKEIINFNPNIVINTHFNGSNLVAKYKRFGLINAKLVTVVTDYKSHELWINEVKDTDAIVVSSMEEKRKLLGYGYKARQIYTSGIPLNPIINEKQSNKLLRKYKLKAEKTILFFLGGGNGATNNLKYLRALLKEKVKANILVIAGKNKKAKAKAESYVKRYNVKNVKVFGFVTNIVDFYLTSDFVITKPGGAQVTECLYFKKPMILIKSNGGQEIGNRTFLKKKGYALTSLTSKGFVKCVLKLLNNEVTLNKMKKSIEKINQEKSMEKLFELSEKLLK